MTLLPTADGDPVTGVEAGAVNSAAARFDAVVVSARVAERLGVAAGAPVTGYAERVRDGATEPLAIRLSIAAVLPIARDGGRRRLAQPDRRLRGVEASVRLDRAASCRIGPKSP